MKLRTLILIMIILILVDIAVYSCSSNIKLSQIKQYKYLLSNGNKYETSRIADITRDYFHNSDTFVVIMDNGDKIYINDYSLSNT